jgi:hypothetical protein
VSAAYSSAVDALSPVAYYKLDETSGTAVADSSGNGYNATATQTISSVSADGTTFDGAIDFDGSTQAIDTGEKFGFITGTGVFSLVFWFKSAIANSGSVASILGSNPSGPVSQGVASYFDDRSGLSRDNTLRGSIMLKNFQPVKSVDADSAITDADFHMVALVGNGTSMELFLDGSTSLGTVAYATTPDGTPPDWELAIGGVKNGSSSYDYTGAKQIAQVAIFSTTLTGTNLDGLYTAATSISISGESLINGPISSDINAIGFRGPPPISGELSLPVVLSNPSGMMLNDFSSALDLVLAPKYALRISGDPILEIPISSWQATLQRGRSSFLQAVIPAYSNYEIADRVGSSNFSIYLVTSSGGIEYESLIASAPIENAQISQGPINHTAVLTGFTTSFIDAPDVSGDAKALSGVRIISTSAGGATRVRCSIDWFLRPGQTVSGQGSAFIAEYINYYVTSSGQSYMDVGDRG